MRCSVLGCKRDGETKVVGLSFHGAKVDISMNVNGGGPKKQKRKKQRMLVELLLDYVKNSTLHGLRYITDPGVSVIERTFWGITFTISAVLCFFFIHQIYNKKWIETPVIISVKDQMVSVGMVPFPSVTICPQQKVNKMRYDYAKELETLISTKLDDENQKVKTAIKLEDVRIICNFGDSIYADEDRKRTNFSTIHNILEVSPTLDDVFRGCIWRGRHYFHCSGIFTKVLTNEGVCFNFNSVAANEMFKFDSIQLDYSYMDSSIQSKKWNVEQNYLDEDSNAYPWRGSTNEAEPVLQIKLAIFKNEDDPLCDGGKIGYKIFLQHPTDFPQASASYYAASPLKLTSLAIKPNMITTSTRLEEYSPNVRKCYLPGEHPLQYFQIYTQKNCQLECQSNYAFNKCGCVKFYMPHNDSESICTRKGYSCIRKALDELAELQLKAELIFDIPTCGCFPACNSIDYDADTTSMDFNEPSDGLKYDHYIQGMKFRIRSNYSRIDFHFKKPSFVAIHRSELYSWIEILANFGGLLGLFLGFSFLSLIEIIYFATIRLCCHLKRDLKAEKKNAGVRSD